MRPLPSISVPKVTKRAVQDEKRHLETRNLHQVIVLVTHDPFHGQPGKDSFGHGDGRGKRALQNKPAGLGMPDRHFCSHGAAEGFPVEYDVERRA